MAPSGSSNSTTTTFTTMAPQLNTNHMTQTTGTTGNAFGSYQLLAVGTSDRNIRVPVPLPMSQLPYRKAMVADLFFGTIKGLVLDSAIFSADLIATTAGYFGFNTSSAEDEATVASAKVRAAIFNVEHRKEIASAIKASMSTTVEFFFPAVASGCVASCSESAPNEGSIFPMGVPCPTHTHTQPQEAKDGLIMRLHAHTQKKAST